MLQVALSYTGAVGGCECKGVACNERSNEGSGIEGMGVFRMKLLATARFVTDGPVVNPIYH